jgi:putative Mg2+ transporter-C (MgtC) family protein
MESKEFFSSTVNLFLIRGGLAIFCGALIGIERERRGKPAGFRTNTLICFGSAVYMLVADLIMQSMGLSNTDPTRIAAQVVTGIGFLGAGTIIQSRGTVTGLTSAATIWVVAAIGICIGAGFPAIGFLCTLLTLIVLGVLAKVEPLILGPCNFVNCSIVFSDEGGRTKSELSLIFNENDMDIGKMEISKIDHKTSKIDFQYCNRHPAHHRFLPDMWRVRGIIEITTEK